MKPPDHSVDKTEHKIAHIKHSVAQQQLASNIARTAAILEALPDIVFVIDRNMRFLSCNEHPDLLLPKRNIIGRTIGEVLPDETGRELSKNVAKAFESIELIYHNYTFLDSVKSFEARYKKIDEFEVLVVIRNTTEQKLKNEEITRLSEVARQTTNGVVITDKQGCVVWINEGFTAISGYTLQDMYGIKPGKLLQGADTNPDTVKLMSQALQKIESFNVDIINYSKAHLPYWMRISCNPLWAEDGSLNGFIAIQSDITKEKRDAELIRNSENLIKAVIDANTIGTWRFNIQTGELLVNDKWAVLLGYELDELLPVSRATWESLTHPDDLKESVRSLEKHARGKSTGYEANIRMQHKNGEWIWINTRGKVTSYTADGKAEWMLGTHFDISAQITAESNLLEKSEQMQAIVGNMLDGVISINEKCIVLTFNQAAERIFGYKSDEIVGQNVSMLMSSPQREQHDIYMSNYFVAGIVEATGRNREFEALNKNGSVFPIELGLVETHKHGELNFIGIVRDITQRKKYDREIHQLAFYDPLTKLPNRRLLLDRLKSIIANSARHNRSAALMFLDLDNFKNLNDSAGHSIGDLLLCQVAKRITESIRRGDTVSRLGGDEFVVLIDNLNSEPLEAANQAEAAAENVKAHIMQSYDLDGLIYKCSASIGVTMLNNQDTSPEELLKQADMAMYKAKATGRNAVQFFDPNMQISVSLRAAMEQDLHDAIKQQQFQLYYQKQVNQQQVIGAEVLLRWNHPEKGIISPAEFIPLAEETGLILPIGEWVLQQTCQTLVRWSTDPLKANLTIAVNLSVVQFSKSDIVKTVLNALKISGANPQNLKLEITESLLASDVPGVKAKMEELQRHGVSFSIDDFGTGYSSLSYLKQLPLNQLKIDQSFVRDIMDSANDKAIAQAVITLADALRLNVIAEGVETEEQRDILQSMGCNNYQGYLFGKPCLLEEFFRDK